MIYLLHFFWHLKLLLWKGKSAVGKVTGHHCDVSSAAGFTEHCPLTDASELKLIETLFLRNVIIQSLEKDKKEPWAAESEHLQKSITQATITNSVILTTSQTSSSRDTHTHTPHKHRHTHRAKGITPIPVSWRLPQTGHLALWAFLMSQQTPPPKEGIASSRLWPPLKSLGHEQDYNNTQMYISTHFHWRHLS